MGLFIGHFADEGASLATCPMNEGVGVCSFLPHLYVVAGVIQVVALGHGHKRVRLDVINVFNNFRIAHSARRLDGCRRVVSGSRDNGADVERQG